MTPLKDNGERRGFNKTEDTVFQFGNSQVSAVFMKKSELLFLNVPFRKWKWKNPYHWKACTLVSQTLNPLTAHRIPCWADAKVSVEGFLKQFISQVEKMDCKSSKPLPL